MTNLKKISNFTLLELLIVVAIIGILVTLLLPSLNRAKQEAYLAVCLSNVNQIGAASLMYSKENDYRLPFPNWHSQEGEGTDDDGRGKYNDAGWLYDVRVGNSLPEHVEDGALWKYLGYREAYRCPGDEAWNYGETRWYRNKLTSYNSNGSITGFHTAFTGRLPSYFLTQLPSNGVYYFCQDITANWNDGGNFAWEIGKPWWPDTGVRRSVRYRTPDHHQKRTTSAFLDGSAKVVSANEWEQWEFDRPGRFYYNPGSPTGDKHPPRSQ